MDRETIEKDAEAFLDTVCHRADAIRFVIQQVNKALDEAVNVDVMAHHVKSAILALKVLESTDISDLSHD